MKRWKLWLLLGGLALAQGSPSLPSTEVQYAPGLLGGILLYLGRQAGLEVEPLPGKEAFIRVKEEGRGPFNQVFPALVGQYLPGWSISQEDTRLRLKPPERPAAISPAPTQGRYMILSGSTVVAEGTPPSFVPAMVVDSQVQPNGDTVDIVLSPLGPACLQSGNESVCLRNLNPGDSGVVPVVLGGKTYTVRYSVKSEDLVLYRYTLRGAPAPQRAAPTPAPRPSTAKPTSASRPAPTNPPAKPPIPPAPQESKPAPPTPLTRLAPGGWILDPKGNYRYGEFRLSPGLKGTWLQVAAFRTPETSLGEAQKIAQAGLSAGVYVRKSGTVVVVAGPDTPETRQVLRSIGKHYIRFTP